VAGAHRLRLLFPHADRRRRLLFAGECRAAAKGHHKAENGHGNSRITGQIFHFYLARLFPWFFRTHAKS